MVNSGGHDALAQRRGRAEGGSTRTSSTAYAGCCAPTSVHMRCGPGSLANTEEQDTPKSGRRRPSDIKIVTTDIKQSCLSPRSASYNYALTSAANLQAVFNDLLRSPAPCVDEHPKRASIHKPIPGRPRSISLPPTPVELPGSILLENYGFPACAAVGEPPRPVSQNIRRSTHPFSNDPDDGEDFQELLNHFPEPFGQSNSVPDLKEDCREMRTARSGNALHSNVTQVQHKKSLSDTGSRRRSRPNLTASPLHAEGDGTGSSSLTPKENNHTSARTHSGAYRLLQPSPSIREGQNRDSNSRQPGTHLNAVSTIVYMMRRYYSPIGFSA
jgi:hypothetical protein